MLFIDIETKADESLIQDYINNINPPKNYKDPVKIQEWLQSKASEAKSDLAVDTDYCKIVSIGIAVDTNNPKIVDFSHLVELLCVETSGICTFNGKAFDIPILIKHAVKHKVAYFPHAYMRKCLVKYSTSPHTDMMEFLAMNGQYKSLDTYAQIYLGKKKNPIDFSTCTLAELDQHCLEDVSILQDLYYIFL